jgi:alkylhydroperoxidase family enzyme
MCHAAVAAKSLGEEATVEAALADWRTADLDPRLRGALAFLEKLTLTPREVNRADVLAARTAGISDGALREAIYVCFMLSTMDRLADAFDFSIPDTQTLKRYAWIATTVGYRNFSA